MPKIQSINPYNQEINWEFELLTRDELSNKIDIANTAFKSWKNTNFAEKKALFLKLAEVFEKNQEEMAKIQTIEMGMLYSESFAWLKNTAVLTRWFANNFEEILADEEFDTEGLQGYTSYDPIGVLYGVAPWNFPFNQVLRAAIPNILAGNTVVYKHASNVPMAWVMIEKLFLEAGFPVWVYQNIIISSRESEYILSRDEVKGMNLTGWEFAGQVLWSLAGKNLKPSVLELGWNDAFIVCDSEDLDAVALAAVKARNSNWGQKCNSSKRIIVTQNNYEEFKTHFVKHMEAQKIWDPMLADTQMPPLSSKKLVEEIHDQVTRTVDDWGKILVWGKKIEWIWNFYTPTILEVDETMTSFKEEVFGPVASLIKAIDLDDAVRIANNSDFGLCGCVFGDKPEQTRAVARQIDTGMVFINKPAWSKASLPFGWIKKSGFWKENGPEGLKAFTNKKVIIY
jgi:succinate-semialdehyde dehydrogenase/glutarate-semialdehyde dehydrogenase